MSTRRALLSLLGVAAASAGLRPLRAHAQQPPVIGVLGSANMSSRPDLIGALHRGLAETGHVQGKNVAIEYRWAEGQPDRLPALAQDLVGRKVAVIFALASAAALAAKAATATIPVVFTSGNDPVQFGLVASLNRPAGNLTGVTTLNVEVGMKRLQLLHEMVPAARDIAVLINPSDPSAQTLVRDIAAASRTLGLTVHLLDASSEHDFDAAFVTLRQRQAGALVIGADPFFNSRSEQLAQLAARHAVPAVYKGREFVAAGGLMSYGSSIADAYRQVGVYTGRILKGDKLADLPVQQSTKVELIINLKIAKMLGLTVPLSLLGRADEVIE
jgi:putative ABC transport system substrate-binding protein